MHKFLNCLYIIIQKIAPQAKSGKYFQIWFFPRFGGKKWRRSEHAHASYPGLFFRPPGFSPYMGREERRVRDWTRGRDSWCWPKGARPLGTRIVFQQPAHAYQTFPINFPSGDIEQARKQTSAPGVSKTKKVSEGEQGRAKRNHSTLACFWEWANECMNFLDLPTIHFLQPLSVSARENRSPVLSMYNF